MQQPHPGNLLALAADPKKMAAAMTQLTRVLMAAIAKDSLDMEQTALVVGTSLVDGRPQFVVEPVRALAQGAALRPVLGTIHLVAGAIYELVKDSAPDDDAATDAATARARTVLQQRGVDSQLVTLFVESAMAAIHSQTFAEAMVVTLYGDGRLMALKGSLLGRLLRQFQGELRQPAAAG
jgi:hypothetical protein